MSTTTDLGKVSVRVMGAWSGSIAYEKNDIVSNDNNSYISLQSVPIGTPLTNTSYWMTLCEGVDNTQIAPAVDAWLNAHPEATTTVQDGAVTEAKLANGAVTDEKLVQTGGVLTTLDFLLGCKKLNLTFTAGFIRASDLAVVTSGTGDHKISNTVLVPAMSLLYVPKISRSQSTVLLCECASDGTPSRMVLRGTTPGTSDGGYVYVPVVTDTYFRFGGNVQMTQYMNYYVKPFDKDIVFNGDNYAEWTTNFALSYSSGPIIDTGVSTGAAYKHSSVILLLKGMTFEGWSAGSSSNVALSIWNPMTDAIVSALIKSDGGISHYQYTATDTVYVKISGRVVAPTDAISVVLPESYFLDWKIYNKDLHYKNVSNDVLYGKKLTVMGDSLIHGNKLYPGATWITGLGIKYGMTYTNLGINGNSVAVQTVETDDPPMVSRTSDIPVDTEYFVLLGGANDKRFNVPLGTDSSSDTSTFKGAINSIISSVRTRCPKAKILLMTTYMRFSTTNTLGLGDADYANAMLEAGRHNFVPVFDNFHNSGVNFLDSNQRAWMDESRNRYMNDGGVIVYNAETKHFSLEGYEWLMPIYEQALKSI